MVEAVAPTTRFSRQYNSSPYTQKFESVLMTAAQEKEDIVLYAQLTTDGIPSKFAYAVPRSWVIGPGGQLPATPVQIINPAWQQYQDRLRAKEERLWDEEYRNASVDMMLLYHPEIGAYTQRLPVAVRAGAIHETNIRLSALLRVRSQSNMDAQAASNSAQVAQPPISRPHPYPVFDFGGFVPLHVIKLRNKIRDLNLGSRFNRMEIKRVTDEDVRSNFDMEQGTLAFDSVLRRYYPSGIIFTRWEWKYLMGSAD